MLTKRVRLRDARWESFAMGLLSIVKGTVPPAWNLGFHCPHSLCSIWAPSRSNLRLPASYWRPSKGFLRSTTTFANTFRNSGETVTLRQMLHHTSGFRDFLDLLELSGRSILDKHSSDELVDLIARQKALNFKPGAEYLYSNTNYFLLAVVISRVTKKPFSEFAAENIFRPLGMTHTRFYDDRTVVLPDRVPAYGPGSNGGFQVGWSTNYDIVGSGGLMSSVNDLLPWDQNFYKNRLGDSSFLREMETRGVLNDGSQINYALGLEVGSYRGLPVVEHNGALMGYRTEILRFPEQ